MFVATFNILARSHRRMFAVCWTKERVSVHVFKLWFAHTHIQTYTHIYTDLFLKHTLGTNYPVVALWLWRTPWGGLSQCGDVTAENKSHIKFRGHNNLWDLAMNKYFSASHWMLFIVSRCSLKINFWTKTQKLKKSSIPENYNQVIPKTTDYRRIQTFVKRLSVICAGGLFAAW